MNDCIVVTTVEKRMFRSSKETFSIAINTAAQAIYYLMNERLLMVIGRDDRPIMLLDDGTKSAEMQSIIDKRYCRPPDRLVIQPDALYKNIEVVITTSTLRDKKYETKYVNVTKAGPLTNKYTIVIEDRIASCIELNGRIHSRMSIDVHSSANLAKLIDFGTFAHT